MPNCAGSRRCANSRSTSRDGHCPISEPPGTPAPPATDLAAAYRDAAGGDVNVVVDFVFGAPGEAALEVLALYGRFLHIGSMAGQSITLRGGPIRRACADVLGFAYYHAPVDVQAQAYAEMCRLAAAGELALDLETRPLSDIATAWDARAAGNRKRQVLVP